MIYISIEIMTELDVYAYGVPVVLLLITAEVIYSSVKGLNFYKLRDTFAGLGLLSGNFLIGLIRKSRGKTKPNPRLGRSINFGFGSN